MMTQQVIRRCVRAHVLPAVAAAAAAVLTGGVASAQTWQFHNRGGGDIGSGDGLWSNPLNWTQGSVPDGQNAWINVPGSGPAIINTTVPDVREILVGQGAGDGHVIVTEGASLVAINAAGTANNPLNMAWGTDRVGLWEQSGGSVTVGQVRAGRDVGGQTATINITGGSFTSTADIRLSDFNENTDADSFLNISGGSLTSTGLLAIGVRTGGTGTGRGSFTISGDAVVNIGTNVAMRPGVGNTFSVIGSQATININRPSATGFEVHQDNDVNFTFDAGGISTVNVVAQMRWSHEDTNLNVDATEFFGSQVFNLFTFHSYFDVEGVPKRFGTENLTFDPRHTGWVNYNDTSIEIDIRLLGDATLDSQVTIADLGALAANWQQTGATWEQGDFNQDGVVNIADLGLLAGNWQAGTAGGMSFQEALAMFDVFEGVVIPEPAALSLLGLGSLVLLRRRRA